MAPAGCGKTHLLAASVLGNSGTPTLILTHTHAGVAALRRRLIASRVPQSSFRLGTLDGFALRMARRFPVRAGYVVNDAADLGPQYPAIRAAAANLLGSGAIKSLIKASFARVFIDEYQDCTQGQHSVALALSRHLPVCAFADELQRIFAFGAEMPPAWDPDVTSRFEPLGELVTPWRWINAGTEGLGRWLLDVRRRLRLGEAVDLRTGAPWVQFRQLTGNASEDRRKRMAACQAYFSEGSLMVIADSQRPAAQRGFARQLQGGQVVDTAELDDLVVHSRAIGGAETGARQLASTLELACATMTGVERAMVARRVAAIARGLNRTSPTAEEAKAVAIASGGGLAAVREFLTMLRQSAGRRVYRPTLLRAMLSAIDLALAPGGDLSAAAATTREMLRHRGRHLPYRAVGSTLLLKGLESDNAVLLDADQMGRNDLYVALTRAAKSVTVFARNPLLSPAADRGTAPAHLPQAKPDPKGLSPDADGDRATSRHRHARLRPGEATGGASTTNQKLRA